MSGPATRRLILCISMSLDGFVARRDRDGCVTQIYTP
jgi:hypothetical protein